MSTVIWLGRAQAQPQVSTLTVGSSTVGHTFITTTNNKAITYTAVTGDTVALIAAAIKALLSASAEGEFSELSYSVSAAVITVTGPDDGAPFTVSVSGGTGTYTLATPTAAVSPNDAANVQNYSTGSLPSANDTLIFEGTNVGLKYGLTALAALPLTYERRETFRGQIGLPDISARGRYREYRTTHFSANGATYRWFEANDAPGQFRLNIVSTPACTWTHLGTGGAAVGAESVELKGLPANSTINISGGSLTLAPLASQTGGASTVRAIGSTLRFGSGATLTTLDLKNVQAEFRCNYTTLTMDGTSSITVLGNATAGNSSIQGGVVRWLSTGTFGNLVIGAGGAFSITNAPAVVAAGTITLEAGSSLDDSRDRIARPWSYQRSNCSSAEVTVRTGAGGNVTEAA